MSKNPQLLNQYTDILKQPTASDAIGDAYSNAASAPANGPAQRETNALLAGIGGGFKASANSQRNSKLQAIEAQTAQLLQADVLLQNQMYEAEDLKYKTSSFFKQNAVPLAELSKASMAGDSMASDQLAQGVLRNYKQIFQDQSVGDFDHYKNGVVYYHNPETEEIVGRNIMSLMYQTGTNPADIWGQDAPMIEAGLSAGARQNYMDDRQRKQLEMQGMGLSNQYKQAQIDQTRMQQEATRNEMNSPQIPDNKEIRQHNLQYIAEQRPVFRKNEVLVDTIDEFKKVIENAIQEGSAGGTPKAKAIRYLQGLGGVDKNSTLAEMFKQVYFNRVKEVGGANPSGFELQVALDTMPSIDKNPQAVLEALNRDQSIAKKNIERYRNTERFLRESNYQASPDDPRIQERMNQSTNNQGQNNTSTQNNNDLSDLL